MSSSQKIKGLCLKVGPLGENDRLLTLLSEDHGITRLAIPGARRPKSTLAATSPLTFLELHVTGKKGLQRANQIKVLRSFSKLGESIETLAAGQALTELSLMIVGNNDPQPGILNAVLIHLERIENQEKEKANPILILAKSVQSCIHLLALGGYCIPTQTCCLTGKDLDPPIGQWDWRCSLIPQEGIAIGAISNSEIQLNPSELALLQRLLKPNLPLRKNGEIMGPKEVWLKFLTIVEKWINHHLPNEVHSLQMLREMIVSSSLNEPKMKN